MSSYPEIKELVNDYETYKTKDDFSNFVNQDPPDCWVKIHPHIKGFRYLPIEKVEYLLKTIFPYYKIEVLKVGEVFNCVYVVVRVHFKNHKEQMTYHDGVGACQLPRTTEDNSMKMDKLENGAVSSAFPIAKTLAIKDACDHIGRIFGSDLNRKDITPEAQNVDPSLRTNTQKLNFIKKNTGKGKAVYVEDKEYDNILRIINNKEIASYDKVILYIKSK